MSDFTFTQKRNMAGVIKSYGFDNPVTHPTGIVMNNDWYPDWDTGGDSPVTVALFGANTRYPISNSRSGLGNVYYNDSHTGGDGVVCGPRVVTDVTHGSAGAMRFIIPSLSGPGFGYFTEVFGRTPFTYIAPYKAGEAAGRLGDTVWYQWYQRFSSDLLSNVFIHTAGEGGFKQAIMCGNPPNGQSSSDLEITMNNGAQHGLPRMYGQQGTDDYGYQDVRSCGYNYNGDYTYHEPPCKLYVADQWMEFTVCITVRGASDAAASRVRMWVDGSLAIDYGSAKIYWGGTEGDGIGEFHLLPYMTSKDPTDVHPTCYTWYDDFLISTQPIPMVGESPNPLYALAASMSAGEWAELTQTNLASTLANTGSSSTSFTYSQSLAWNPQNRKAYFVGGDHNAPFKFYSYDADTNLWTIEAEQNPPFDYDFDDQTHSYDMHEIDPIAQKYYMEIKGTGYLWVYDVATGVWSQLEDMTLLSYMDTPGVCWFPERQSLISAHTENTGESGNEFSIVEYTPSDGHWHIVYRYTTSHYLGNREQFVEYNPVLKNVLITGGTGTLAEAESIYTMDADGTITQKGNAPVRIQIEWAVLKCDPVTGKYIILYTDLDNLPGFRWYVYDSVADTWTLQEGSCPVLASPYNPPGFPLNSVVATPISNYGVIMYAKTVQGTSGKVYLYKQSGEGIAAPRNLRIVR